MNEFFMTNLLAVPLALLVDVFVGEPKRFHPLIGFGNLANWIEKKMNQGSHSFESEAFKSGVIASSLVVIPIVLSIFLIQKLLPPLMVLLFTVFLSWLAIGWKSLQEHGLAVATALEKNDLDQARIKTSYIVSRDTSELDENTLSRASIESILENGNDAIFAAIFWLALLGAPGIVLYRLSNTLDAMWGYRNDRYEFFGKFTARVDDVLNYIPARLCALLYAVCGNTKNALNAWKNQASDWYSPNAGVVMATGAGALNIRLGGAAIYHGRLKQRPDLGSGKDACADDIQRSIRLLNNSVYLLAAFVIFTFLIVFVVSTVGNI